MTFKQKKTLHANNKLDQGETWSDDPHNHLGDLSGKGKRKKCDGGTIRYTRPLNTIKLTLARKKISLSVGCKHKDTQVDRIIQ